jgi:uncharacterized protein (TIGR03066 family)
MKEPMNFKLILIMLFCGICVSMAGGCKKDKPEPKIDSEIVGLWMDTSSHILEFRSNGKFSLQIIADSYTTLYGTYSIQGDSIQVKIKSQEVRTGTGPGVKTNVPEYTLYEKGTFEVNDEKLKLKYISYPFDAPVETSVVFTRTHRID